LEGIGDLRAGDDTSTATTNSLRLASIHDRYTKYWRGSIGRSRRNVEQEVGGISDACYGAVTVRFCA
jgi:hypothetical protein